MNQEQIPGAEKIVLNTNDFDAVIFDMDGTMVDNTQYHKEAWIAFLASHDIAITSADYLRDISGRTNEAILPRYFGRLTSEQVRAFAEEKEAMYRQIYRHHLKEVDGLTDFLHELVRHGKHIAVATSAPKANRDFVLEALGLTSKFATVVGYEEVTHAKPAPDIYLETARRLGVEPRRCVVFEDTPSGVKAGVAADMKVIGVLTGHEHHEISDAAAHINSFKDMRLVGTSS